MMEGELKLEIENYFYVYWINCTLKYHSICNNVTMRVEYKKQLPVLISCLLLYHCDSMVCMCLCENASSTWAIKAKKAQSYT